VSILVYLLDEFSRSSGFFFFHAEDGIRDFHVTGVQTCALPIWLMQVFASAYGQITIKKNNVRLAEVLQDIERQSGYVFIYDEARSEERRVGKECRSRGSTFE